MPFEITDAVGRQGVRLTDEGLRVPLPRAELRRLHVLVVGLSANAELRIGAQHHAVPERTAERPFQRLSLVVAAGDAVTVAGRDCLLLAATQAVDDAATGAAVRRRGRARFHGVDVDIACMLRGVPQDDVVDVADGASVTFTTALAFAVGSDATAAARNAIGGDAFARHHASNVQWYVDHAPRLSVHADTARERLRYENLWTYRWFLLRHNLAHPNAGHLTGGPVFYEGRHGSWYPRVISFSTPHIVAEARWLRDPSLWSANVRAHVDHIDEVGELRNVLVHWRGFRYTNWIGAATVDALKVHPDRPLAERLLPALIRNVTGQVAHHDRDGDGVLAPGDHYTTGMEFQPSFWFFDGYDNRKPQADLERPDFTSYVFGNAVALAEAARWLDRDDDARAMDAVAAKLRAGTLDKLWNDDERFFLSIRERDDAPALTPEVIGFYPFRFALPPDEPRYRAAFDALVDPAKFWTPYPPASCSRTVPVFSAAVQRWPGPGGLVTPCMWNGPTWPHATSLVADAIGVALRRYEPSAVTAEKLGELLDAYARFHFEDGDPSRPLLREYGDGETGVNWGCADYLHSTWIDLVIRHAIGLQPRLDDTLEVHRLPLGLPGMSVMGLRYHGHVVDIDALGDATTVYVDGVVVGRSGSSERAFVLPGVLAR